MTISPVSQILKLQKTILTIYAPLDCCVGLFACDVVVIANIPSRTRTMQIVWHLMRKQRVVTVREQVRRIAESTESDG